MHMGFSATNIFLLNTVTQCDKLFFLNTATHCDKQFFIPNDLFLAVNLFLEKIRKFGYLSKINFNIEEKLV